MLMDEPFGAIDPINREVIQDEFLRLQRHLKTTVMFVSHDLDEAIKMADRIAIFRDGKLEQFATPTELLAQPANAFVEEFLGSDRALKRLRLVRVTDAMDNAPVVIKRDDPIEAARQALLQNGHSAVFVVGPNGRLRGMITKEIAEQSQGTVSDHAVPVPVVASTAEDLRMAVASMFAHDQPTLPCVDESGVLRGALTYASVTTALKKTGEMD